MAQSALWRNGFFNHVARVAEIEDDGQRCIIVGGARYFMQEPGQTDIAFTAEILPGNIAMLSMFQISGFRLSMAGEPEAPHAILALT